MSIFLSLFAYRSAFLTVTRLRNPFSWTQDLIKVDMLLSSSDMTLFTQLRSAFVMAKDVKNDDTDERNDKVNADEIMAASTSSKEEHRLSERNGNESYTNCGGTNSEEKNSGRQELLGAKMERALKRPTMEHILELDECRES